MPTEFRVKLRKVAETMVVTIPKPAIDGLKWKEGDPLILSVTDHEVVIKKART